MDFAISSDRALRPAEILDSNSARCAGVVCDQESKAAREAFGDVVVDHYLNTARQEQAVYDRRVSDVDLQRNFERA